MRIQMLIVGPLAVALLGYPNVILKILSSELVEKSKLFMVCAVIFLLVATLGPCGGILQMTGNEKVDNQCREIALIVMVVVTLLTHNDVYFVLYGLCSQIIVEAILKYTFVCYWMESVPTSLKEYLKWWIQPCIAVVITYIFKWQESFIAMVFMVGVIFIIGMLREVGDNIVLRKQ